MMNGDRPDDFEVRWKAFVDFFNTVKAMNPVQGTSWEAEVSHTFFDLLNSPGVQDRELTLKHGLEVLKRVSTAAPTAAYLPLSARDVGFVMFVFVVFGAVWGNGGVLPLLKAPNEDVPPDLLQ